MNTEMNIKVNIDREDKEKLDEAYCVLNNIECALSSWERNEFYPYGGVNMFYVIRDNYCDYEYEIIAGSKSLRKALSEMVKDVFKNRPDVDIEEIVDDIDNGGEYDDSDTKIWGDGALVDGVCRWCITRYDNKEDNE